MVILVGIKSTISKPSDREIPNQVSAVNPTQDSQKKKFPSTLLWIILSVVVLFLLLYKLNDWPRLFWDEGWTLDAAQNWVNHAHLGHYLDGQPVPPYSPVRFPVVVLVALSMKLFGAGTWQGRLPIAISSLLTLALFFYLGSRIFSRKVTIAALIVLLILTPLELNPIILGRQMFAELPMMLYLFVGYLFLWLALTRHPAWGIGAALFFGISVHAKLQVPPFWLASILMAIWVSLKHQQKHAFKVLLGVTIGSILSAVLVLMIQNKIMPGSLTDPAMLTILFNSVVVVVTWPIRKATLTGGLLMALPQILGFIWAGQLILRPLLTRQTVDASQITGEQGSRKILYASLWGLGASWCFWYLFLALMWTRYLFPPYFIGCIFFADYLDKLTDGFDLRILVRRISALFIRRQASWINMQSFVVLIAFSLLLGSTLKSAMVKLLAPLPDAPAAAAFLTDKIPAGSRVETFESDLIFLAPKVNFHFPPDLVSMQLVRKYCIDPNLKIDYDPLQAKPDYLVIGPYGSFWQPYDPSIVDQYFSLDADIGGFQIYRAKSSPSGN